MVPTVLFYFFSLQSLATRPAAAVESLAQRPTQDDVGPLGGNQSDKVALLCDVTNQVCPHTQFFSAIEFVSVQKWPQRGTYAGYFYYPLTPKVCVMPGQAGA